MHFDSKIYWSFRSQQNETWCIVVELKSHPNESKYSTIKKFPAKQARCNEVL